MNQVFNNIYRSKAPLMVILRYIFMAALIAMGIARLRITLLLLAFPENYTQRDILQIYLMAKGLVSGLNPYLPLSDLAMKFVGDFPFFPHPAPYPPFNAILFIPLQWLSYNHAIIFWYIFELVCLAVIACLLCILFVGRLRWLDALITFFILLAWYPVMADLEVGQLSILLTLLILASLLAMRRNQPIFAGVLIGFTVAIKLVTWPLIIFLLIKKEWRAAISSLLTALGMNLIALLAMGFRYFLEYYTHASSQALEIYHKFWANFSMLTIGYRLFEGTDSAIFANNFQAPPLINLPVLAPYISIGILLIFFIYSLVWASRSKNIETAFAIMVCLLIAVSPIVWDHYFVILVISLVVMLKNLVRQSFPGIQTIVYFLIVAMFFFFNDRIGSLIILLNGGNDLLQTHGYKITFASSLLSWLPIIEIIALTILLWLSNARQEQVLPVEAGFLPAPALPSGQG